MVIKSLKKEDVISKLFYKESEYDNKFFSIFEGEKELAFSYYDLGMEICYVYEPPLIFLGFGSSIIVLDFEQECIKYTHKLSSEAVVDCKIISEDKILFEMEQAIFIIDKYGNLKDKYLYSDFILKVLIKEDIIEVSLENGFIDKIII